METIYIYQFSNESGSREFVVMSDWELSQAEIDEYTYDDVKFDQVITADVTAGSFSTLPLNRSLSAR